MDERFYICAGGDKYDDDQPATEPTTDTDPTPAEDLPDLPGEDPVTV